jgi:hypothetical protein
MQTGYQTYNEVLQDNTLPDTPYLYYDSMFIPPLAPDDFEAIRADMGLNDMGLNDMGLNDPSYTTGTDGLGTGLLPYQLQPQPSCYQVNATSVGIGPFMPPKSPIPRSTQQDQYPLRRPRHQGVRHEPYNSRLETNKRREQYDQPHTVVRDPSDLVFPIVGPESDDINWQAGWSISSYNPEF